MILAISWIVLCFLVAFSGNGKKIGYAGVFFLSLILSPLIGLIIGLASSEEVKKPPSASWKCGKCGFLVLNLADTCSNCSNPMNYANSAYDSVKYICTNTECKKPFYGRKEACPHCSLKYDW